MSKSILIIAAHPDDQVLGCGGTVARLVKEGCEAHSVILGEGVTSRDSKRTPGKRKGEISGLKRQTLEANAILGISGNHLFDLPDNRFDSVPLLDVVKVVEEIISKIKPDVVFTHYPGDLNVDHKITYEAVITATRPMAGAIVKEIYSFEILSSTEWRYPLTYAPDVFYDITGTLPDKLTAMSKYLTELKDPTHPRSLAGIKANATLWGLKTGFRYAEAFKTVRALR